MSFILNNSDNADLRGKTITAVIWSFVERFGYLSIQFVCNILLARMLSPHDFGVIGIILVFISISMVLIDSGLGSALIQKQNTTAKDYSTIFYVNIFLGIIVYSLIFAFSGLIASFYEQPLLEDLLKVLGVVLVIDSFSIIQNNILMKNLLFKKIAKVKIIAAFLSSSIAIILAYKGFGVWALVAQYLLNSIIRLFLLTIVTKWKPLFEFSKESFYNLFGFGSKLLLASLLSELYQNFQQMYIGKFFSIKDLGFFTQARQLEQIPVTTLGVVVNQVTYPVFSLLQSSKDELVKGLQKSLKSLVYINFPVMILLSVIGKPLFIILFTDKWLNSVIYFQLLCLGFGLLLIIHNTNLNVLKALGYSNYVLNLEVVKKIMGVILILLGAKYGIIGMIVGLSINSVLEFFLNGYFVGKVTGYGIKRQLIDILPIFILSLLVGFAVYSFTFLITNYWLLLIVDILAYISIYLFISHIFNLDAYKIILSIIKDKFIKK